MHNRPSSIPSGQKQWLQSHQPLVAEWAMPMAKEIQGYKTAYTPKFGRRFVCSYPPQKVVALSAEEIRGQLVQQTPRAVKFGRLIAVLLFFLIQAIPFGIIGYAAYKDIKVHV